MEKYLIKSERLTQVLIIFITLLSLLVIWTLFITDYNNARNLSFKSETLRLLKRDQNFAGRINIIINSSKSSLEVLNKWVEFHPEADTLNNKEFLSLSNVLSQTGAMKFVLRQVDAEGNLLYPDKGKYNKVLNIRDRDYVQKLMNKEVSGFCIGNATKSYVTGRWGIPLALNVNKNQKNIKIFYVYFESDDSPEVSGIEPYKKESFYLVKKDGTILMTFPARNVLFGKKIDSLLLKDGIRLPSNMTGDNSLPLSKDINNIITYAEIKDYPLYLLNVSYEPNHVFFEGYLSKILFLCFISGLILSIAGILVLLFHQMHISRNKLNLLARTDSLTGIENRRAFFEYVASELNRLRAAEDPACLLMIDVDFFKTVNDTFGHQKGDAILVELCRLMRKATRTTDTLARLGGEEFAVFLPCTNREKAYEIAERLRIAVREVLLPDESHISVSIGIAEFKYTDILESLLNRADKALYRAKDNGRDKVVVEI